MTMTTNYICIFTLLEHREIHVTAMQDISNRTMTLRGSFLCFVSRNQSELVATFIISLLNFWIFISHLVTKRMK